MTDNLIFRRLIRSRAIAISRLEIPHGVTMELLSDSFAAYESLVSSAAKMYEVGFYSRNGQHMFRIVVEQTLRDMYTRGIRDATEMGDKP